MVEVFKTDVLKETDTYRIISFILKQFPGYKVNFDLEDCDKILRVEGLSLQPENIAEYVSRLGYVCIPLE